jgi:hypothetical protein
LVCISEDKISGKRMKYVPGGVGPQAGKSAKNTVDSLMGRVEQSVSYAADFIDCLKKEGVIGEGYDAAWLKEALDAEPADVASQVQDFLSEIITIGQDHANTAKKTGKLIEDMVKTSGGRAVLHFCWNHKRLNFFVLILLGEAKWMAAHFPKPKDTVEWREGSNSVTTFMFSTFKMFSHLTDAYVFGKGCQDFILWLSDPDNEFHILHIGFLRMTSSRNDVYFENAPRLLYLWDAMYLFLQQTGPSDDAGASGLRSQLISALESVKMKAMIRARGIWFFQVAEYLRIYTNHKDVDSRVLDMNQCAVALEKLRTSNPAENEAPLFNASHKVFPPHPIVDSLHSKFVAKNNLLFNVTFESDSETDELTQQILSTEIRSIDTKRFASFFKPHLPGGEFNPPSKDVRERLKDTKPHTDENEGVFGTLKLQRHGKINTSLMTDLAVTNWRLNGVTDRLRDDFPPEIALSLVDMSTKNVQNDATEFKRAWQEEQKEQQKYRDMLMKADQEKELQKMVKASKLLLQHKVCNTEATIMVQQEDVSDNAHRALLTLQLQLLKASGVQNKDIPALSANGKKRSLATLKTEVWAVLQKFHKKELKLVPFNLPSVPTLPFRQDTTLKKQQSYLRSRTSVRATNVATAEQMAREQVAADAKKDEEEEVASARKAARDAARLEKKNESESNKKKAKQVRLLAKASRDAEKAKQLRRPHWVGCDKCDKWRIVSLAVRRQYIADEVVFQCDMYPGWCCEDECHACERDQGGVCPDCREKQNKKQKKQKTKNKQKKVRCDSLPRFSPFVPGPSIRSRYVGEAWCL